MKLTSGLKRTYWGVRYALQRSKLHRKVQRFRLLNIEIRVALKQCILEMNEALEMEPTRKISAMREFPPTGSACEEIMDWFLEGFRKRKKYAQYILNLETTQQSPHVRQTFEQTVQALLLYTEVFLSGRESKLELIEAILNEIEANFLKYKTLKKECELIMPQLKKTPSRYYLYNETDCSECDECAFCLEQYQANEDLIRLDCSHHFHEECMSTWLRAGKETCPICRTVITFARDKIQDAFSLGSSTQHEVNISSIDLSHGYFEDPRYESHYPERVRLPAPSYTATYMVPLIPTGVF